MYSKYEIPQYNACLFYYDKDYSRNTSGKVLEVLEKHGMFPPQQIYADKLTGDGYVQSNENTRELFVNAYAEKDVFGINMSNRSNVEDVEFWEVDWTFTFYKGGDRNTTGTFEPWNVLCIKSTHGRLEDLAVFRDYIQCVKELIGVLCPFYASVDDAGNWVHLMHDKHKFTPGIIPEIFWGNYFGSGYCKCLGKEKLEAIPAAEVQKIGEGIYFSLTEHVSQFASKAVRRKRKEIKKYLRSHNIPVEQVPFFRRKRRRFLQRRYSCQG